MGSGASKTQTPRAKPAGAAKSNTTATAKSTTAATAKPSAQQTSSATVTAKPAQTTEKPAPPKAKTTADMQKEATAKFEKNCELFKKSKGLWAKKDLTSKELHEHVLEVKNTYSAYKEYPYSIISTTRGKQTAQMVELGSLQVICEITIKALEENTYFTKESDGRTVVQDQADMITNCLILLSNTTDTTPKVRKFVVNNGKLLPLLLKKLDEWHPGHEDGSELKAEAKFINKSITILYMIAAEEEEVHIDHLRGLAGFFKVLKKYLDSKVGDNRLTGIAAIANVAKEAEAEDIAAGNNIIHFLLEQFKEALKSEKGSASTGWTIVGLGKVVKNLARNDANKQLLVKEGVVPLLQEGLADKVQKTSTKVEKKSCLESLWWLSFDAENRKVLAKNEALLDEVVKVYKQGSANNKCYAPAEGFIFQMRENLSEIDKYKDIANKLLGNTTKTTQKTNNTSKTNDAKDTKGTSQESTAATAPAAAASPGHVMMSYQTQQRPIVKSICDFLGQNGFKMWMDIYCMAEGEESTLQTMAEAVEGSVAVLMCVSETYKNSPYCRAEAEYAFMKDKQIIPLKLQAGYSPDGWLGIIQGSKYFYDFTKQERVEEKRKQLLEAVKKCHAAISQQQPTAQTGPAPVASAAPVPTAPSYEDRVKSWTKKDVADWLAAYNLKGDKLEALTGEEVLYLHNLKSDAPEFFNNMLRNDLALTGITTLATFTNALNELPTKACEKK